MIPNIEDVEKPVIGRYYMVPAVAMSASTHWIPPGRHVPVLGDFHEDIEIIGFPEVHVHPDFRFVQQSLIDRRLSERTGWVQVSRAGDISMTIFTVVFTKKNTTGVIERVKMRCNRLHPTFPKAEWTAALEEKYEKASARCGVCPHRAMPLAGAPVRNGARVCPGHGLAWNVKDGSLVRRSAGIRQEGER